MPNLKIQKFNLLNADKIERLYEKFCRNAKRDYKYESAPLPFRETLKAIKKEQIKGFILFQDNKPEGFLLYTNGYEGTIEINLVYINKYENIEEKQSLLIISLMDELNEIKNWRNISFALMGKQEFLFDELEKHNFGFVKQGILKLNLLEGNIFEKLGKIKLKKSSIDYTVSNWCHEHFEQGSIVVHDAFKNSNDTKFDSRFLSLNGTKDILYNIISGRYGYFDADLTSIALTSEKKLIGACFLNFTTAEKANISIVATDSSCSKNNIGTNLLKQSIDKLMTQSLNGKYKPDFATTTVDLDNKAAVKMYKKIGFKEDYTYAHAYLKNPNI